MPDIFISYSREDQSRATTIAASLEAEGFDVWWDAVLRSGEAYDEVTEENLRNAGAVVVLWSKTSSKSKWVRAEATIGERHSTLMPALIEECDRPLRFELIQTTDLIDWRGDRDDPTWQRFVADISNVLGKCKSDVTSAPIVSAATTYEKPAQDNDTIETVFWSTIKETTNPAELEAYLKRYKNGHFVSLARSRLESLRHNKSPKITDAPDQPDSETENTGVPRALIAVAIFIIATMGGMAMLFIANAIHIGWFIWTPDGGADLLRTGAKEVGFFSALNWSLAAIFLMPAAWTMIYLAFSEMGSVWNEMVRHRMIISHDFKPIAVDHAGLQKMLKHIRIFVFSGIVIATTFTVTLALSDHSQVAGKYYALVSESEKLDHIDVHGYPLEAPNIERDWMVASFLSTPNPHAVNANANRVFSLVAYVLYVGLGIGALLSFGLIILGLGATFMHGIAQNYGLRVIPNLESNDARCGFEVLSRFFTYALTVAFIGYIMCYLMGIQNLYLRSPHEHIVALLAPNFTGSDNVNNWRELIDSRFGFLFAENVAKGTRNIYVWIFGFFIFAVFIGGFMLLVRQGAIQGRTLILEKLKASGFTELSELTNKNETELSSQLNSMHVWPLTHPSLRTSLASVVLFIISLILYKVGALIVVGLCIAFGLTIWRPANKAQ